MMKVSTQLFHGLSPKKILFIFVAITDIKTTKNYGSDICPHIYIQN